MSSIKIISLADEDYFEYLCCCVASASLNFSEASFFVVLVNPKENYKERLKSIHNNIEIVIEKKDFSSHQEKKCYCASRRAFLFYDLRSKTDDILLWIDADSIIRSSCKDLIEHLNSCDITMRPKDNPGKFASGVIGVNNSNICYDFVEEYYKRVSKDNSWMSDQNNLNETYSFFKDKINYQPLENKYCDVWLSEDGVIWEAKSKKKKDKKYLKEMRKYGYKG